MALPGIWNLVLNAIQPFGVKKIKFITDKRTLFNQHYFTVENLFFAVVLEVMWMCTITNKFLFYWFMEVTLTFPNTTPKEAMPEKILHFTRTTIKASVSHFVR